MLQCVVTNAAPFCPVWESCPIGLLAEVSMEGEVAKSLVCIGPKSPRTVADISPLDNGPAIVRSIQRIFGVTPRRRPRIQARIVTKRRRRACRDAQTQRAGEWFAFFSVPASFVGGVPLTRAMNPWAMPEAST